MSNTTELLDAVARVLIRCAIFGYLLLILWFGIYELAPNNLRIGFGGLTPHEIDVITYSGVGLTKLFTWLIFILPYIAIRLVIGWRPS
jgi:hypothetical protein